MQVEAISELRYDLPAMIPQLTQSQLYAFTDYGALHTTAPAVGTLANATAASAGAGLRLGWTQYLSADLQAAKALEGPIDEWRFFFIVSAKY